MSGAFGARLGWGDRPALLLVDAVVAYSDPGSPLWLVGAADALDAMATLLRAARAGDRPVIWTTVAYRPGRREAALFRTKVPALSCFEPGAGYGAWPEAVAPDGDDWVVVKHHASAFFGTDLASGLSSAGVDTVVVGGFSTSGCVRASATDALQHGYRPMVVAAACADRDASVQDANLADLDAKYADVVGLDEAADHLRGAPR